MSASNEKAEVPHPSSDDALRAWDQKIMSAMDIDEQDLVRQFGSIGISASSPDTEVISRSGHTANTYLRNIVFPKPF